MKSSLGFSSVAVFSLAIAVAAGNIPTLPKNDSIDLLVLLLLSNSSGPRTGAACQAGMEIVFDEVNSRTDILPKFNVNPVFLDEGSFGTSATNSVYSYVRNPANKDRNSPLILGTTYSPGCVALGPTLQYINKVHLTPGCNSNELTARRSLYPNLYRMRGTSDLHVFPHLRFVRDIGHWKRIGVVIDAVSPFYLETAKLMSKVGQAEGMEFSYFRALRSFDENEARALRESDTRIIVILMPMYFKVLCEAYKVGIKGPRYIFILLSVMSANPENLPPVLFPGCTKKMILEQSKILFGVTWVLKTEKPFEKSSLGLDHKEFLARFNSNTRGNRKVIYDRSLAELCYDNALQGVLALDKADKNLNKENMSLSNYSTLPEKVMDAVNSSVAGIEFYGLRHAGKFRYSERLEHEYDRYTIMQWTADKKWHAVYYIQPVENLSAYNFSAYSLITKLVDPVWFTADGKPPADGPHVSTAMKQVPYEFLWTISALAVIAFGLQSFFLYSVLRRNVPEGQKDVFGHVVVTVAGWLLDMTAVLFALSSTSSATSEMCAVLPVLLLMALSLLHGFTFFRLAFHQSLKSSVNHGFRPPRRRYARKQGAPSPNTFYRAQERFRKKLIWTGVGTILALSAVFCAVWMAKDKPQLENKFITSEEGVYDERQDTVTIILAAKCSTKFETVWIATAAGFHALLLLFSIILAVSLRTSPQAKFYKDLTPIRQAAFIATTLFAGICVVTVILQNSPDAQVMALSVCSLIFSLKSTTLMYWPYRNQASSAR